MKAFSTFLGIVFGLALLAALLAGGYFLFRYVMDVFATLEPTVATLTAIASVVALLCATIIASGLKARSQKDQGAGMSVEKARIYEQLLALCRGQLRGQEITNELAADDGLVELEQLLALHGSPNVITAYVNLRRQARQEGKQGDEVPAPLNKLVMDMRGDLGRTALNLKENDLLALLLGRY